MLRRTTFHLVLILFMSIQVTVHGGIQREIRRKAVQFWNNLGLREGKKPNGPMYERCNVCVWGSCTPAMKPPTDSESLEHEDADTLIQALNRVFINREAITNILTSRSGMQRKIIGENFQSKVKVKLATKLARELDGTARHSELMVALATPLPEYFAIQFQRAIEDQTKGGQGRIDMVEMFTTLSPCLIRKIITVYNSVKGQDFVTDIKKSLKDSPKSDYIDVFKTLAQGKRDDKVNISWLKAWQDAMKMKKAIETDNVKMKKEVFIKIFTKRSIPQLKETVTVYENLRHGAKGFSSLVNDINTHMESVKDIYTTMVKIVKNQPLYFASIIDRIFETHTEEDDSKFISVIRERCDIDLGDIKEAYSKRYQKTLLTGFSEWEESRKHYYDAIFNLIT